jgi:hypothetical protein
MPSSGAGAVESNSMRGIMAGPLGSAIIKPPPGSASEHVVFGEAVREGIRTTL